MAGPRDRARARALQPGDRAGPSPRHPGHAASSRALPTISSCTATPHIRFYAGAQLKISGVGGRNIVRHGHRAPRDLGADALIGMLGADLAADRRRRTDAAEPVDAGRPHRHLVAARLPRRRRTADRAGRRGISARSPARCSMSIISSGSTIATDMRSATLVLAAVADAARSAARLRRDRPARRRGIRHPAAAHQAGQRRWACSRRCARPSRRRGSRRRPAPIGVTCSLGGAVLSPGNASTTCCATPTLRCTAPSRPAAIRRWHRVDRAPSIAPTAPARVQGRHDQLQRRAFHDRLHGARPVARHRNDRGAVDFRHPRTVQARDRRRCAVARVPDHRKGRQPDRGRLHLTGGVGHYHAGWLRSLAMSNDQPPPLAKPFWRRGLAGFPRFHHRVLRRRLRHRRRHWPDHQGRLQPHRRSGAAAVRTDRSRISISAGRSSVARCWQRILGARWAATGTRPVLATDRLQ